MFVIADVWCALVIRVTSTQRCELLLPVDLGLFVVGGWTILGNVTNLYIHVARVIF